MVYMSYIDRTIIYDRAVAHDDHGHLTKAALSVANENHQSPAVVTLYFHNLGETEERLAVASLDRGTAGLLIKELQSRLAAWDDRKA